MVWRILGDAGLFLGWIYARFSNQQFKTPVA
jgi:hypothetical protein